MKLAALFIPALLLTALYSCNQNGAPAVNPADTVSTSTCYIAVDGQDTAHLTVKKYRSKVGGELVIDFKAEEKGQNYGEIKGAFKGDTLFVDYIFRVGIKPQWHKNPLALLQKDGKLHMGIGKMETMLGKTYFRKDIPIDFSKGRFVFEPVDCKKQVLPKK